MEGGVMNLKLLALAQVVASEPLAVVPVEAFRLPITDLFDRDILELLTNVEYASPEAVGSAKAALGELVACALLAGVTENRMAS
jgi:hypothetical protein